MMSAPAAARAWAIPNPIPLVDPVTTATFPFRLIASPFHAIVSAAYAAPHHEPALSPIIGLHIDDVARASVAARERISWTHSRPHARSPMTARRSGYGARTA